MAPSPLSTHTGHTQFWPHEEVGQTPQFGEEYSPSQYWYILQFPCVQVSGCMVYIIPNKRSFTLWRVTTKISCTKQKLTNDLVAKYLSAVELKEKLHIFFYKKIGIPKFLSFSMLRKGLTA